MKRILATTLILAGALFAQQFAKVGQAGAKFLSIPLSPRAVGMGETFVSVANDPYTVFINPAGLANLENKQVLTSMVPYWASTYLGGAAFTMPTRGGKYAVFVGGLMSPGFEGYELNENNEIVETGTFSYMAMQMGASYAQYFTDKFSLGITLKGVYEGYGSFSSAWTFATDVGTYYKTGFRDLTLAMVMQNFGPDLKPAGKFARWGYTGGAITSDSVEYTPYPLPLLFRVGMSMSLWKTEYQYMLLAAEITHPNDNRETYALGVEYNLFNMLYLRSGYRFQQDEGGFSTGMGLNFFRGQLDYSYSEMENLPDLHRIGLSFAF